MFAYWDPQNVEHIGKHGVTAVEAREVLDSMRSPYPEAMGDDKFLVWGATDAGRYLQVIFVFRPISRVDLRYVPVHERLDLEDEVIYVIHSRDLTSDEKRRLRRRKRS